MAHATALTAFSTKPTKKDPYTYQVGFGNYFASEALPDTLPADQNSPQKCKYDLYPEQMTGSPFVSPRAQRLHSWLYRIRPSVAHQGFTKLPDNPDLESNFLPINPKVHASPARLDWGTFDVPKASNSIDFIDGLKTIAGNGDPTLKEGLAIHMYLANASMQNKAFCNNDGDFLILPQLGRLDIQTEFGKLMVRPGELVVIQRGTKFKIMLPDGPSRGYIQEIFGSHYVLPELGPLGANVLANTRDFEHPLAHFDIDQSPWNIVYKTCGKLFNCSQEHTPFDVVAWHGNYVPYKYAMEKFVAVGSITKDHPDPSIFCVLTAPSKNPNVALTDFLVVVPRWDVASNTLRVPYYHRNVASEFLGILYGEFPGRSDVFQPGAISYDSSFCPHGVSYDEFKMASEADLVPMRVQEGSMLFMLESTVMLTVTDYAMHRSGKLSDREPKKYFKAQFMDHLDKVKANVETANLPKPRFGSSF